MDNTPMNSNDIDSFLKKIAQVESNGGTNTNHKMINSGIQKGTRAIGTFGLMPNTVDEMLARDGSNVPNADDIINMEPAEKKAYLEKNPDVEYQIARQLASHVLQKQGGDEEKAAYAWNQGHNLSPDAIENRDYQNADYVKKFDKTSSIGSDVYNGKYANMQLPDDANLKDQALALKTQQSAQLKKAMENKNPFNESDISDKLNSMSYNPSDFLTTPAKDVLSGYDDQVDNRLRAGANAAMQGSNPVTAAVDNPPTSGEDVAKTMFKTIDPGLNVAGQQVSTPGQNLQPFQKPVGAAIGAALDPMNLVPMANFSKVKGLISAAPEAKQAALMSMLPELNSVDLLKTMQKGGPLGDAARQQAEQNLTKIGVNNNPITTPNNPYRSGMSDYNYVKDLTSIDNPDLSQQAHSELQNLSNDEFSKLKDALASYKRPALNDTYNGSN